MLDTPSAQIPSAQALCTLVGSLLAVAILLPGTAPAQTPNATIENGGGTPRLQSFYDGGLLAPGIVDPSAPNDSIPAEGAGTRLMWYPAKAAIRAGRVGFFKDGTQWNAEKVGSYSVAFGVDTKANGFIATAMGERTTASGANATAMGDGTIASGGAATAMGAATTASAGQSTAMGRSTTASSNNTTAMGLGTEAATFRSLSLGECNSANQSSDGTLLAVGNGSYDVENDACSSTSDAFTVDEGGSATASSHDTFSDRRLKTSVRPLGDVLGALRQITPVRFRFKDERTHPSGEQIGLIAQEVQNKFPELVNEGADGMLSLAYPKLTAVLLKGFQEQHAQIETQHAQIDSLTRRVEQLAEVEQEVAALRTELQRASSATAGWTGPLSSLFLAALLGGLVGAGLLWRWG